MKENTELWTMELLDRIKTKYNLESIDDIPNFVDNLNREVITLQRSVEEIDLKYVRVYNLCNKFMTFIDNPPMDLMRAFNSLNSFTTAWEELKDNH